MSQSLRPKQWILFLEIKMTINYMDLKEFREKGYLQELNRCFLHPLGLALEMVIEDDGTYRLGGIWDYRHEGISFADGVVQQHKIDFVSREMSRMLKFTDKTGKTIATLSDEASEPVFVVPTEPKKEEVTVPPVATEDKPDAEV